MLAKQYLKDNYIYFYLVKVYLLKSFKIDIKFK